MARVLVTGGAGFIGSHLVDLLVTHRHQVTVVDNLESGAKRNVHHRARLVRLDIRSPRLSSIVMRAQPLCVFHLAAQKNVRFSVEQPRFDADVNVLGSLNLLEACTRARVRRFIFASSGGVMYGSTKRFPTPENEPALPESPYGISKYAVELYLRFFQTVHGLRTVSLRFANVYGPRQDPKGEAGVVAIFAQRALRRQSLWINGSGRQTRDYIYVDDVVAACALAMDNERASGEINIGTGVETTVTAIANQIRSFSGRSIVIKHRAQIVGELGRSSLRSNIAARRLGWRPRVGLTEGLKTTWRWAIEEWGR